MKKRERGRLAECAANRKTAMLKQKKQLGILFGAGPRRFNVRSTFFFPHHYFAFRLFFFFLSCCLSLSAALFSSTLPPSVGFYRANRLSAGFHRCLAVFCHT